MALPPLNIREKILYKDTFTAYAPNRDQYGQILNWSIAKQPDGTPLVNIAGNAHLTPNFDAVRSPAGLDKVTSFETSNNLTCQPAIDLYADYRIYITVRASAGGRFYWFMTDGDAENETLVPCTCVFLVPDIPGTGVIV